MNRFKWFIRLLAVIGLFLSASTLWADGPAEVVDKLHGHLLDVMKDAEKLGYSGRYDHLSPVIQDIYDLPFIARIAVGRYWREFNREQKDQYIDAFSRMSIATYASRFDGYSGERFQWVSTEELRRGRKMVKTFLIKKGGEKIPLNYILHEKESKWKVINVMARGVSDLSMKRADYTAFLEKNSPGALIEKLHEKITLLSK